MEHKLYSISFRKGTECTNLHITETAHRFGLTKTVGPAAGTFELIVLNEDVKFASAIEAFCKNVFSLLNDGWVEDGSARPLGYRSLGMSPDGSHCSLPLAVNRNQALKLLDSVDYIVQPKMPGTRMVLRLGKTTTCHDRNGNLILSSAFEHFQRLSFSEVVFLDGVVLDGYYHIFDCIHFGGIDMMDLPLIERLQVLDDYSRWIMPCSQYFALVPFFTESHQKKAFFQGALEGRFPGVLFKNSQSTYALGRVGSGWYQHLFEPSINMVVIDINPNGYLHLGLVDSDGSVFEVASSECNLPCGLGDVVEVGYLSARSRDGLKLIGAKVATVRADLYPHQCTISQLPGVRF